MENKNSSVTLAFTPDSSLQKVLTAVSSLALCGCLVAMVTKIVFFKVFPTAWKCCLLCQDVACFALSVGLILVACNLGVERGSTCKAGGFFVVFGFLDFLSSIAITGIVLLIIQNPAKMSQLSSFRWQLYISCVISQKILTIILAAVPVSSVEYFDTDSPYTLACFPVRQEGRRGAAFGAVLIFIMWGMVVVAVVPSVILAVRYWTGSGTRVHASTPSLWQSQKIEQSKTLHKFSILELSSALASLLVVTIVVYTNSNYLPVPQWAALLALAGVSLLHVLIATVQLFLWSGLCYDKTGQKKEPHHRLKQLELIRTEGPGKLRLKASWAAGKDVWKRGLLKVYGPAHIKAWAQEIVVLGLLRKSHSASVLNCLWTSNMNPYHEAMTLISGDIVTSDSRLTCLELTSAGTLQELLKTMEVPLPETCQRTIMHDIAEGLSYLHDQNVLHRNLTSAAVYIKGSVQSLVLRAAIGDFEDAHIYGTLLTGSHNSAVSRKQFFLPDIRAYALVGIEMMIRVCECKQKDKKQHWRSAFKASSSSESTSRHLQEVDGHGHQNKHPLKQSQSSNREMPELPAASADGGKFRVRRFDKAEIPYCVPGEPEYIVSSKENIVTAEDVNDQVKSDVPEDGEKATVPFHSYSSINTKAASEENNGREFAEYNLDNNWKLQKRKIRRNQHEDNTNEEWRDTGNDAVLEKHKASSEPSLVKKANNSIFPNYSAFRALNPGPELGEQEMIEEDIARLRKNTFRNINGHYQQAGYVTSITDDGREIFIPAAYKLKKSGENSSSGYGSCSGSTIMQADQSSSAAALNSMPHTTRASDTKRLHKTISVGTTSLVQDNILEVLPAVCDNEYTSNYLLRDLLKAKEDAKLNKLMMNYEERVRNQQLPKNNDHVTDYCPSVNNPKQYSDIEPHLNAHDSENPQSFNEKEHHMMQIVESNRKQRNGKLSTLKAVSEHRIHQDTLVVKPAEHLHPQQWKAKSSLKRSKARVSLKKALTEKTFHGLQLSIYQESRGTKGKEVEHKYSSRHGNSIQKMSEINSSTSTLSFKHNTKSSPYFTDPEYSTETHPTIGNSLRSQSDANLVFNKDENRIVENRALVSSERTLPSGKSRPAPKPPAVPYTHNVTHVTRVSTLDPGHTDTDSSQGRGDQSFTSVEPPSTESDHMHPTSPHSHEMSIDKIESDMNDIINSNSSFAAQSSSIRPLGMKMIDSGFDSASISSDESCLCAAAALQIPEESSSLYPSDIISQGRCSCACSSCLGSIQGLKKESSWQDSPDSESWNNSNSFSSYDTNMHRRKLPSKGRKHDSTECILAPDDKYPSPNHQSRSNSVSALHSVPAYSLDRRQQQLPQSQEHLSSSASESSTAISRRYRELIKRGVPLRVSIISGEDGSVKNTQDEHVQRVDDHSKAHADKNDNGEYNSRFHIGIKGNEHVNNQSQEASIDKSNRRPGKNSTSGYAAHFVDENNEIEDGYNQLSPIPSLEEIIKEIPDETGCFPDETKAFLNRPDSELSVKALQAVLSGDCYSTDDQPPQCPELVIDQFFSQRLQPRQLTYSLSLDQSTSNEATFHSTTESLVIGHQGLATGADSRHVMYCQTIASSVSLISINDLLPVSSVTFHTMKSKLQKQGGIGVIGNQILDVMGMCWLNENPPTTTAILNHLTDPVTETEL